MQSFQWIFFIFLAQGLLKEWSKHRYGVFPEVGYEGDVQYPNFYKVIDVCYA